MTRLLPLVFMLAIAWHGTAQATLAGEVNKCVDADGKVTYSSQPCPENSAAEKVKLRKGPSSNDAAGNGDDEEGAGEPGSMQQLRERLANTDDPVLKAQLELTKQQCELARTQLDRYEDAPYLMRENNDGTKTRLTDDEAAAEKARLRRYLAQECR